MTRPALPEGASYFIDDAGQRVCAGAKMGIPDILPTDQEAALELTLERLEWEDGDYIAENGAYFGFKSGTHIYRSYGEDAEEQVELYCRATSVADAEHQFKEQLPNATFTLDTARIGSEQFDEFTQGYIECMIWQADDDAPGGDYSDTGRSDECFSQLDPRDVTKMKADCAKFQLENEELLRLAVQEFERPMSHLGHDLALSRVGAGTGFWDRGMGDVGDQLHAAAKALGWTEGLYKSEDDGKWYLA